ncbi:MAG: Site-specific DNA-methyltransferase (Adenine-specific) [Parcubacteria group bacterium GW2011_GWA2_47_64]|nr:MAG: Site-specific DNA-methyltransferase (Adenine-specific) [Parcubacteria group bacterium GW2011_GWA2_47_64]
MAKNIQKINLTSSNLSEEKLQELRQILPEVFAENKIDWDKLKTVLGSEIDPRIEKFGFTWAGKSNAIKSVIIPSGATLRLNEKKSVDFNKSENIFVEGDNLEVLKLLQKAYFEKIKVIYIDPPYNTGADFIYPDNFASPMNSYLEQTGQKDSDGNKLQTNKETNGRFHSDWLSMMYPRLKLAWNLLKDDGVIFVSIDDNEVHHLRMLLNETFGEENFIAQIIWENKEGGGGSDSKNFKIKHEYVLCFAKDAEKLQVLGAEVEDDSGYTNQDEFVKERGKYKLIKLNSFSIQYSGSLDYPIKAPDGSDIYPSEDGKRGCWRWSKKKYDWGLQSSFIVLKKNGDDKWTVYTKQYFKVDNECSQITRSLPPLAVVQEYSSTMATKQMEAIFGKKKIFDYSKPYPLIKKLIGFVSQKGSNDIVLDFFAGSATTGHAVLSLNQDDGGHRKFILVQLPELIDVKSEAYKAGYKTITEVGIDRLKRVIKGYADNPAIKDGFKLFELGISNYPENNFEFDPDKSQDENKKAFQQYLDKAKQGSLFEDINVIDVVYENIVKEGLSLNSKVDSKKLGKNTIFTVVDGERSLFVCLDKKVESETVKEFAGRDYKGRMFICIDNALDDSAKANLSLNLDLKTI